MSRIFVILCSLVLLTTVLCFEDDHKKMNPILRHFSQQSLLKPYTPGAIKYASSKIDEGYRNCYLSPIQCQLPVRREQQPIAVPSANMNNELSRYRRMFYPLTSFD